MQFNPVFVQYFTEYIHQLVDVLKKLDCFYHPRIKIGDEPKIWNKKELNFYTNLAKLIKEINPQIYPQSAGFYHPNFLPYYNQWYFPVELCPILSGRDVHGGEKKFQTGVRKLYSLPGIFTIADASAFLGIMERKVYRIILVANQWVGIL